MNNYDVIIAGGGPAGLSAALVLGRARRRVLVCDSGQYRNAASHALHGFLTRDGIAPAEFLDLARADVARYPSVELRRQAILDAGRTGDGFDVTLADGTHASGRKLIVATGVVDELPPVEGAEALYGRGLFHCPYCDGWEVRDQPLAVYGRGDEKGAGLALELTLWTSDLVLCTDGPSGLGGAFAARLRRFGIPVREEPILRLEGGGGSAVRVVFERGTPVVCRAMFFNTGRHQRSDLARRLGCDASGPEGCRLDNQVGKTRVVGLYVIGDASRDVLQVVIAAGEGSAAAIAVNQDLLREDGVL